MVNSWNKTSIPEVKRDGDTSIVETSKFQRQVTFNENAKFQL